MPPQCSRRASLFAAGGDEEPGGVPAGSGLSTRELEIPQLILKGLSNSQINGNLGITEGTVKWHINIILSRLNVSDLTQAVVTAIHRGIVDF